MKWIVLAALALSFGACTVHDGVGSLSPRSWPEGDLAKYVKVNSEWGLPRPAVTGTRTMIAGTTGPLAIRAGIETLRLGGSAADAAITTALAQITLSGGSWNSFAGICHFLYYMPSTGEIYSMNAAYNTPLAEREPLSIPAVGIASGRTVLVPGFIAGVESAHRKFGKLPFANLFAPAIFFAEEGFTVDASLSRLIESRRDVLTRLPGTRSIFQKSDGSLYRTGDHFCQPSLGNTLKRVAAEGSPYMYRGPWAKKLVELVRSEGGALTLEDLERYEVEWHAPLRVRYRGYEVVTSGLPNSGPVHLVEALQLLECANLKEMGVPAHSAKTLYTLIQAARLGPLITHSEAYRPYPDAAHAASEFSPEQRISTSAGRRNWDRIQNRAWQLELAQQLFQAGHGHSDAVVAIDHEGNIAVMVHTINTASWGTTGIFVDGVSVPDSAAFQQTMIAKVGPGKRLPNEIAPVIVLERGSPRWAAGCIGASLQETMLQNLVFLLDFGMDLTTAVKTPKFMTTGSAAGKASDWMRQLFPKDSFSEEIGAAVQDMGQPLLMLGLSEARPYKGYWVGIEVASDGLHAVVTPGLNGVAVGD